MHVPYRYAVASTEWPDATPESEHLDTLLAVFQRVCDSLDLDMQDESLARTVARTIIEAGLAGEVDPEGLFERAMRAVVTS